MFFTRHLSAISRFDLERAREEAEEKRGRVERARQEYGAQVSLVSPATTSQLGVTNSQHRGFYRETWPRCRAMNCEDADFLMKPVDGKTDGRLCGT